MYLDGSGWAPRHPRGVGSCARPWGGGVVRPGRSVTGCRRCPDWGVPGGGSAREGDYAPGDI